MIPKISDELLNKRIEEFLEYVNTNNRFVKRGKDDIKFKDGSCLMGEWFKSSRKRLKQESLTNKKALLLLDLSNKYMKKTDKENIDKRFSSRIEEMISFIKINNYFPNREDKIFFKDKSSKMYIWYYCNKNRIKDLILKGDIYAKELYSLEQKYRKYKYKNKYPNIVIYQGKEYRFKDFAKFLNISVEQLEEYLNAFCNDIYNIKQLELERMKNTVLNIERLKNITSSSMDKDVNSKIIDFCKRKNLCIEVVKNKFDELVELGLTEEEAYNSIKNEYNNNNNTIPTSWIYETYNDLEENDLPYNKETIIELIKNKGLDLNDSLLMYVVLNCVKNYNEPSYMTDIIFYTLKGNDYNSILNYSKNLFKLDDFHIKLIEGIKKEYEKLRFSNSKSYNMDRKTLLEELLNNYDYYNENKMLIQERYNLSKFEIMFIEARYNELLQEQEISKIK